MNRAKVSTEVLEKRVARKYRLREALEKNGGKWLARAREWMQSKVMNGDRLAWSDATLVSVPFSSLQELALAVAVEAITEAAIERENDLLRCSEGTVGWLLLQLEGRDLNEPVHLRDPSIPLFSRPLKELSRTKHVPAAGDGPAFNITVLGSSR